MRKNTLVQQLALLALATACTAHHTSESAATPSPLRPLRSCETREITLDRVDMLVQANVDGTLGSVVVLRAPDSNARADALGQIHAAFGKAVPDTRIQTHPLKWGIVQLTDMCGRPTTPPATPPPTSTP